MKKHCNQCTMNFEVGRPYRHCEDAEPTRCPDCGLVFSHDAVSGNIIRCWVDPVKSRGLQNGRWQNPKPTMA